jgi:hypothetical protein
MINGMEPNAVIAGNDNNIAVSSYVEQENIFDEEELPENTTIFKMETVVNRGA